MALNSLVSEPRPRLPVTLLLATAVIVAGVSIAATSAYFELTGKTGGSSGPGTVSVVDDLGRTVSVPTHPDRIVLFGPNILDSLYRIGVRGDVVGVDCSSAAFGGVLGDYTPNQTAAWNLTDSMCVQALPSINTEELLNKSPDLILATSVVSESALDGFSATYNVPVVWLIPDSLSGIVVDVELLGQLFPDDTQVAPLVASLQSTLASASTFDQNL
jgi:iron complex transport system substrate-binding protein